VIDPIFSSSFNAKFTLNNGCFCLSNTKNDLYPSFDTLDILCEHVEHYLADDKHRKIVIKKAQRYAKDNTYIHRLKDIATITGLFDVTDRANAYIKEAN